MYHAANLLYRLKGDDAVDQALAVAGLDRDFLNNRGRRIEMSQVLAFFEAGARLSEDNFFGLHVGENFDMSRLELPGYAAKFSPDLGTGFTAAVRYIPIIFPADRVEFDTSGNAATATFHCADPFVALHTHQREFALSAIMAFARQLTGTNFRPIEVRFQHQRHGTQREIERVFGCPVSFGSEQTELLLTHECLSLPILTCDTQLLGIISEYGNSQIKIGQSIRPGLLSQIEEEYIKRLPHSVPNAEQMASTLGMSNRTLARRLKEIGTSFRQVADDTRFALARNYLGDKAFSLSEVAYLVGYADQPSFITAFRRWSGNTPGLYRQSQFSAAATG